MGTVLAYGFTDGILVGQVRVVKEVQDVATFRHVSESQWLV